MSSLIHTGRSFYPVYKPWDGQPQENLLGCVEFGLGLKPHQDPRHVAVSLNSLGAPKQTEQWLSDRPVQWGRAEGFGYGHNGEVLFGSLVVPESELHDLERATLKAYVRIEWFLRHMGYPCYLRMWNFLARINDGEGDHERYRQFSAGRHRALALKPGFERELPAGTAIGTFEPGLVIYFLAGTSPGTQVENPRQISAYHYPRQHGPKSPSFARATLVGGGTGAGASTRLMVSGTASIVGHESLHPGDLLKQIDETLANIDALLAEALLVKGLRVNSPAAASGAVRAESLKLYLREAAHLAAVKPHLPRLLGANVPLLCLQGEICRRNLLLEVEGTYLLPSLHP
jgi:chorismate lyase/3-hydroxybenzoate synthase